MTQLSPENLDRAFALLVECAVKGERCPVTSGPDQHSFLVSDHVSKLAHAGRIRVETSGHNWRQVTILQGEHAGKKTKPNPNPSAAVYITMDQRGTLRAGKRLPVQPSAPRALTAAELRR